MDELTVAEGVRPPASDGPLRFGQRYRALALLGSGGMGSVYLARDEELDELVAVKVLRRELLGDATMVERFRDEVRLARRVSSPRVARTHDLAHHDGRWFVTMEYVEGETLAAKVRREGRLTLADVVPIARDTCDGLSAVHGAGIVHRDLKPGNVLVTTAGRAILADFGIALRVDAAGHGTDGSGTPTYVAPEQLAGRRVDARADIFSLGAMLFTLVTGKPPFPVHRTGKEPPPDPRSTVDVSDAFAAIVTRAMALDPERRFPSSDAMKSAIDALALPASAGAGGSMLRRFVQSLDIASARKVFVGSIEVVGMPEALATVARVDLLARLSAGGGVRVVQSRADAEAVLSARFVDARGQLRLSIALRSVDDGYEFWEESLDGALVALPQMIERAAHAIERAFSPASKPVGEAESFPSEEVARLFLEARVEYRAFWGNRMRRSVELFEQALALAPDHPTILAWYAAALARLGFFTEASARARELAIQAATASPRLAEARIALGTSYMLEMQAKEAVPHFVAAITISPGLVEQRVHLARTLHECGAVEPALTLAESTFELDPTFTEPIELLVRHYAFAGRIDLAAEQVARLAHASQSSLLHVSFTRYCAWARDRERFEAQVRLIDLDAIGDQPRRVVDLFRRLVAGERVQISDLDAIVGGPPRRRCFMHQIRAEAFAFKHDLEGALSAIELTSELGLFDVQWLDRCPLFDPLRGVLRFEAVRHRTHGRAIDVLAAIEACLLDPRLPGGP